MSGGLPDGCFPRLNSEMVNSGKYDQMIASVVGRSVTFDGASALDFECADGGKVRVTVDPSTFTFVPGKAMEIMGAVQEDCTVQVCYSVFDILCHFFEVTHLGAFLYHVAMYSPCQVFSLALLSSLIISHHTALYFSRFG